MLGQPECGLGLPCGGSYLLTTYPNPVNDVLKLSIKMMDEARRQQLKALATGDDIELSFNASSLPGGTYFVVVKLDGSDEEPQRAMVMMRR